MAIREALALPGVERSCCLGLASVAENPGRSETAARIADIVEAALELERSEWPSFLDRECSGDHALRAEVESLLGYREQAAEFIEGAAIQANAEFFANEDSVLRIHSPAAESRPSRWTGS